MSDGVARRVAQWLTQRLTELLHDASDAEAIAAGVEVLLAFEDDPFEDRIIQAVALLREQM